MPAPVEQHPDRVLVPVFARPDQPFRPGPVSLRQRLQQQQFMGPLRVDRVPRNTCCLDELLPDLIRTIVSKELLDYASSPVGRMLRRSHRQALYESVYYVAPDTILIVLK